MADINWSGERGKIDRYLSALEITDGKGESLSPDDGFSRWKRWTGQLRSDKNILYLIGNGASASIASHMASDLAKNALVHTQVFSDLSLITAMANDIGYDEVYATPLRDRGNRNDMLVGISSSGQSKNILNAARVARSLEMTVITLSAMSPDNPLRSMGSLNLYLPAEDFGHAETCHAAVLHYWMDLVHIDDVRLREGRPTADRS